MEGTSFDAGYTLEKAISVRNYGDLWHDSFHAQGYDFSRNVIQLAIMWNFQDSTEKQSHKIHTLPSLSFARQQCSA